METQNLVQTHTYPVDSTRLELNDDFNRLLVYPNTGQSIQLAEFDLEVNSYFLEVKANQYQIKVDAVPQCASGPCPTVYLFSDEGDTVGFEQARLGGTTIVRIEDFREGNPVTIEERHTYTFYLDQCPVWLFHANSKLAITGPANQDCQWREGQCVDITNEPV